MRYQYTLPFLPFTQLELTCEHCAERFQVSKRQFRERRYCSPPCVKAARAQAAAALFIPGVRFGRLTTVRRAEGPIRGGAWPWICRCDCGATTTVLPSALRRGETVSCGCWRRERMAIQNTTHGLGEHLPEYKVWLGMRARCERPYAVSYPKYGARGVSVCERWQAFEAFYADMGPRPTLGHSLDRIDGSGNYEPGNVRWATSHEQIWNRSNAVWLTFEGESAPLSVWAARRGIKYHTLWKRLLKGWSIERALTTPVRRKA